METSETQTSIKSSKCGLCVSSRYPYPAASPDRVIDEETMVDRKCRYTARDGDIAPDGVGYLQTDGQHLKLSAKHQCLLSDTITALLQWQISMQVGCLYL